MYFGLITVRTQIPEQLILKVLPTTADTQLAGSNILEGSIRHFYNLLNSKQTEFGVCRLLGSSGLIRFSGGFNIQREAIAVDLLPTYFYEAICASKGVAYREWVEDEREAATGPGHAIAAQWASSACVSGLNELAKRPGGPHVAAACLLDLRDLGFALCRGQTARREMVVCGGGGGRDAGYESGDNESERGGFEEHVWAV
ncbi:hypothetical protein DFH06DRAFT_1121445 [Mycena polygramma]|nr:hypothetical protein DFH06DRAFT_1121445 [Mycena polygramma]